MMHSQKLINDFQNAIVKIYRENGLNSLKGIDGDCKLNDRNILAWHSNVVKKGSNKTFNYFKNIEDILFCSDELLYFTANLYLYRPHINNPLSDSFRSGGNLIYPYYENTAAKRYSIFSDVAFQCAYNYWARIADLLASFFSEEIKRHDIFFGTVLDKIPEKFHASDNYLWLKNFKDNDYMKLNKKRREIVHYTSSNVEDRHAHLDILENKNEMEQFQVDRESLPDLFKEHILLTFDGFERVLLLIEEILV